MMRALTHIHTTHSWDSRNAISRLASRLTGAGVELALVCDHNSFQGSLDLRSYATSRGLALRVPVAAEVRTDRGDVIVVFDHDDPPPVDALLRWRDLPGLVRGAGGLIWLPHPFQSHTDIEELAAEADIIEGFNARCSSDQNSRATDLCRRHAKVPAYGADIHRLNEVGRFTVEYEWADSVCSTLLTEPTCPVPIRTRRSDVAAAEIVNGLKRRSPALAGFQAAKWAKHRAKELAGRAPDRRGP